MAAFSHPASWATTSSAIPKDLSIRRANNIFTEVSYRVANARKISFLRSGSSRSHSPTAEYKNQNTKYGPVFFEGDPGYGNGRGLYAMDAVTYKGFKQRRLTDLRPAAGNDAAAAADNGFKRSKLAVFLSGGGSNFRSLHAATLSNSIYGDIVVVVSDKPGCKGCDYARQNNLPVLVFPSSNHAQDGLSPTDLVGALRNYGIDYILLAGYLKLLPSELVQAYPRSILNIHPALLPAFGGKGYYGMKVHEAVIRSGARFSGATIHFVDESFDTGPILAQRIVPVVSEDTPQDLASKVLKEEHLLYPEAVAALCENRIFWRHDGVPQIRKSWDEAEYSYQYSIYLSVQSGYKPWESRMKEIHSVLATKASFMPEKEAS